MKKPKKEVVIMGKNKRFRITKDFSTPIEDLVEPEWWYYLEVSSYNFNSGPLKRDWLCIKCSTSFEEIEKIYNLLLQ